MILGFILVAGGHIGIFFVGTNIELMIVFWIIASLGQGIACSMPFAMLSDTVDFGEWKTGIRASGFLTAIGSAFCIKAGSGIGGFIWLCAECSPIFNSIIWYTICIYMASCNNFLMWNYSNAFLS